MDTVTLKTAIELKQNGFEQPLVSAGQFWESEDGDYYCIIDVLGHYTGIRIHNMVFRPIAIDILRDLPNASLTFIDGKFVVYQTSTGDKLSDYHDNPAEACAEAWLNKNSPTP